MIPLTLAVFLFASTEIAPGVVLVPGQLSQDRSPDGNTVLLRGSDGWVVIDTGRGGEHTDEVLRFLADSGAAPRAVLNTHWHLDHIGGNADFVVSFPRPPSSRIRHSTERLPDSTPRIEPSWKRFCPPSRVPR